MGRLGGWKGCFCPCIGTILCVSEGDSVDTRAWDPGPVSHGLSTQALPIQSWPPLWVCIGHWSFREVSEALCVLGAVSLRWCGPDCHPLFGVLVLSLFSELKRGAGGVGGATRALE